MEEKKDLIKKTENEIKALEKEQQEIKEARETLLKSETANRAYLTGATGQRLLKKARWTIEEYMEALDEQ